MPRQPRLHAPPTTMDAMKQPTAAAFLRWLPAVLAIMSWFIGWGLVGVLLDRTTVLWALPPTLAVAALRIAIERNAARIVPGSRAAVVGYAVHLALTLTMVALNPFGCIYAFIGYQDADRFFVGRQVPVVIVLTAVTCAFGQAGSFRGLQGAPLLFIALLAVNLLIALSFMRAALAQERHVAERERAADELARISRQNAVLHQQLLDQARTRGIAEERARLSREIHDTVAQGLVGVISQLEALPADLDPGIRERVARAEETARGCLTDARRAVAALAPQQLDDDDLADAVGAVAAAWARNHRVVIEFDADAAPDRFQHGPELLRVVQEGLSNVARHAQASGVRVTLGATAAAETVTVADDGRGFHPDAHAAGHGLPGMRERLAAAGGWLDIRSAPGHGTTLTATIPVTAEASR